MIGQSLDGGWEAMVTQNVKIMRTVRTKDSIFAIDVAGTVAVLCWY